MLTIGMALAIVTLGGYGLWRAFRPSASSTPGQATSGYYLLLPEEAQPAGGMPNPGAILPLVTNLPEGTIVVSVEEQVRGGGYSVAPAVRDGRTVLQVANASCVFPMGSPSAGFNVVVLIAPSVDNELLNYLSGHGYLMNPIGPVEGKPSVQPQAVLSKLGEHFENLEGEQVIMIGEDRVLLDSRNYAWPEGCDSAER